MGISIQSLSDRLQGLLQGSGDGPTAVFVALSDSTMMYIWIATLVLGVLVGFFGLKLIRLWAALTGFVLGTALGGTAAVLLDIVEPYILIIALVTGIVFAILCAVVYRVGLFIVVWLSGSGIVWSVLPSLDWQFMLAGVGIGLVLALLTLKFYTLITIVVTGISGAIQAGPAAVELSGLDMVWLPIVSTVVLAVLGILVQLTLESGKRKRQNLKKAAEIRKSNSTANEVEKARAMMEDLDQIPEDDSKEDNEELVYLDDEEESEEPEYLDDEEEVEEPEYLDDEEEPEEPEYLDDEEAVEEPEYLDDEEEVEEPEYLDDEKEVEEPEYLDDEEEDTGFLTEEVLDFLDDDDSEEEK